MTMPLERVHNLLTDLRMAQVDFDALFAGKSDLTPLEAVELFLWSSRECALKSKTICAGAGLRCP